MSLNSLDHRHHYTIIADHPSAAGPFWHCPARQTRLVTYMDCSTHEQNAVLTGLCIKTTADFAKGRPYSLLRMDVPASSDVWFTELSFASRNSVVFPAPQHCINWSDITCMHVDYSILLVTHRDINGLRKGILKWTVKIVYEESNQHHVCTYSI